MKRQAIQEVRKSRIKEYNIEGGSTLQEMTKIGGSNSFQDLAQKIQFEQALMESNKNCEDINKNFRHESMQYAMGYSESRNSGQRLRFSYTI